MAIHHSLVSLILQPVVFLYVACFSDLKVPASGKKIDRNKQVHHESTAKSLSCPKEPAEI